MTTSLKEALAVAILATSMNATAHDTKNITTEVNGKTFDEKISSEQITRGKAGVNGYYRVTYTLVPSSGDISKKNLWGCPR